MRRLSSSSPRSAALKVSVVIEPVVSIAVEWLNQEQRVEPVTKAEVEAALGSHGGRQL